MPEADRQAVAEEFLRVIAGSPTHGFENPVVCRDGSRRWIVWNARYLPDYEDGPAILKVGQDITFLKQAQERALQAERLAAIGQMVTGLAHESRNALQRSQACLEMLALDVRDRPEALDLIGRLQKAQDHLHHALRGRPRLRGPDQARRKAPCDLAAVWREAWAHLEPARKGKQAVLREDDRRRGPALRRSIRSAWSRSSATSSRTPWPPARAPVAIEVRAAAAELDGQPALRVAVRDNGPGLDAGAAAARSSSRSSRPRPRGPAWAWPSPSGSSRPTAARSPSATATAPGRSSSSLCREDMP